MMVKKLVTVGLVLGILAIASAAFAQRSDSQGQEKEKTLVDRLDDLGKSIFGGILPLEKTKAKDVAMPRPEPRPYVRKPAAILPDNDPDVPTANGSRAGSILSGKAATQSVTKDATTASDSDLMPENTPPAVLRAADGTPKAVRRPLGETALLDDLAEVPAAGKSALRPLHERLTTFRQSAFGTVAARRPNPQPKLQPMRSSDALDIRMPGSEAELVKPVARPMVAQRTEPEVESNEAVPDEPVLDPAANSPLPIDRPAAAADDSHAATDSENQSGVLFSHKGPLLNVETLGPRRIAVGKESVYEVGMVNSGEVAAEDVVVFVSLPEWAEVAGAEVSTGTAQAGATGQTAGAVQWKLGHLDTKGRQRLTLRIVPRQNRPFDLAVRWECKPAASQAMIEVQEPKLDLQIEGPREVSYGKKEVYRLRLTNSGNGAAENVALMLMPIGGGENVPATYKIGLLPAGEEKTLDVELTARQSGNLTIQVDARADGGVHAELAEKVFVRRAGLKIDVDGPKVQFVGAAASYSIRVRNPGTAPARNVNLSIVLPAGAKYISGIENARLDDSGGKLEWSVETISPEVEQSFALKCSLGAAGISRVEVNAAADDGLTASAGAVTRVEAVANLVMEVIDPEKPVPVGEEATYEVRVRNRGTKDAKGVEVFAYFSRGVEPTGAEGGPNRLGPGQVAFQPIAVLAPGAETVLKVYAKAEVAGNHVFRAEAHCKPLGSRLIREASNLYYDEAAGSEQTARELGVDVPAPDAMRTGSRPVRIEQTIAPPRK